MPSVRSSFPGLSVRQLAAPVFALALLLGQAGCSGKSSPSLPLGDGGVVVAPDGAVVPGPPLPPDLTTIPDGDGKPPPLPGTIDGGNPGGGDGGGPGPGSDGGTGPGDAGPLPDIDPGDALEPGGTTDPPDPGPPPPVDPGLPVGAGGPLGRDRWGGLQGSGLPTRRTGFFHIEKPAGAERTWLIDPDGNPFWAVGLNTVLRTANADGMEAYLRRDPSFQRVAEIEWDRLFDGAAGGYGYRFNNVGGFSHLNDLEPGTLSPITRVAPYGIVLEATTSSNSDHALRTAEGVAIGDGSDPGATLGDPFNPAYQAELQRRWTDDVRPGDPNLMYYWIGNENGLFDHPLHGPVGVRDLARYLWTRCPAGSSLDQPLCAPHALGRFLRDRYGNIDALDQAWGRPFGSFESMLTHRPGPGLSGDRRCENACPADMQRFVRVLWRRWVEVVTTTVRALDPDHLVSSPRLAAGNRDSSCFWGTSSEDVCRERFIDGRTVPASRGDVVYSPWDLFARQGQAGFDLISINVYSRADRAGFDEPWFKDVIHKVQAQSGLPVLISEFGVRARIDGWTNNGGAGSFVPRGTSAEQQRDRGDYYVYDMQRFMAFRGILGASFHRWADRYLPDTQMNMGLVHRNGTRWPYVDAKVRHFNAGLYSHLKDATGW